jgi:hypothetical protein
VMFRGFRFVGAVVLLGLPQQLGELLNVHVRSSSCR